MTDFTSFIAGLPKAELHVHHVGSASPTRVAQLAPRHEGSTPVPPDPALLADYFTFTDFAHFIEVYLSVVDLIRDAEDVWTLTYEVAATWRRRVRYAELTLTPYSSVVSGIPAEAFCEAVEDARARAARDFGLVLRWCFDIPGEAGCPPRTRRLARPRPRARRADQLRARRPGDRRAAAAVQAALRRRARRRPAQRAARGRVDRARDDLGRDQPSRRGAHRARHPRPRRPGADGPPGEHAIAARGLPDLQPRDPVGRRIEEHPLR